MAAIVDEETRPDPRVGRRDDHPWHVAVNRLHDERREKNEERSRFMYEAKAAAHEVPRLMLLFKDEREGRLTKIHRQCTLSPTEHVVDNHLTCCLGVECRKCPELLALEKAELTPEAIDRAKAWTCVAHVLSKGGDVSGEGYILTEDDKMFWQRTYESMAAVDPGE